MEVSGLVFRPTQFPKSLFNPNPSLKPRSSCGFGFSDNGHLKYYGSTSTRCEGKSKNNELLLVEDKTEKKKIKKKLKYLKELSRNMLMFPDMVLDQNQDQLPNTIAEATTILLGQLKKVKAEKKMQKRRRKEEKQKLRAARMMKTTKESTNSSSSSSSESSDDEAEMVVNMSRLRSSTVEQPQRSIRAQQPPTSPDNPLKKAFKELEFHPSYESQLISEPKIQVRVEPLHEQNCCTTSSVSSGGVKAERIDVCVGGKCRKMGGAEVLEEFERKVGMEGRVVGCKCMGKCRSGPNVKVHTSHQHNALQTPNPLYIGVGLEDVGAIVSQIFGDTGNDLGLVTN